MSRMLKKTDIEAEGLRAEKRCPHCGHSEFKARISKFTWLFGERFVCSKCHGTFKHANLVRIDKKEKHYRTEQIGGSSQRRRRKRR